MPGPAGAAFPLKALRRIATGGAELLSHADEIGCLRRPTYAINCLSLIVKILMARKSLRRPARRGFPAACFVNLSTTQEIEMREKFRRLFTALFALMFAASFGIAYAGGSAPVGFAGDPQQNAPKDCNKDPNDPRCKE